MLGRHVRAPLDVGGFGHGDLQNVIQNWLLVSPLGPLEVSESGQLGDLDVATMDLRQFVLLFDLENVVTNTLVGHLTVLL